MTIAIITVIIFAIELYYFRLASRFNIVDKPNERSSHSRITLRGGGIVFPIAAAMFFFLYGFIYPLFFIALILISLISFGDDVRPLPNKIRILVHFIAVLLMFAQWEILQQPIWILVPLMIIVAGIINAFNFMDGINGITGGYSLVIITALGYVNLFQTEFVNQNLINIIIISLLIFNFFNFRTKAKCFAGDVGSVSISFIIVFMLGLLILKTQNIMWLIFLAVYGVDSVLTILHRLYLKENIFQPHRRHLYQLLANECKVPHLAVSLLYMTVQALIIIGFLLCMSYGNPISKVYCLMVLVVLSLIYFIIKKYNIFLVRY